MYEFHKTWSLVLQKILVVTAIAHMELRNPLWMLNLLLFLTYFELKYGIKSCQMLFQLTQVPPIMISWVEYTTASSEFTIRHIWIARKDTENGTPHGSISQKLSFFLVLQKNTILVVITLPHIALETPPCILKPLLLHKGSVSDTSQSEKTHLQAPLVEMSLSFNHGILFQSPQQY